MIDALCLALAVAACDAPAASRAPAAGVRVAQAAGAVGQGGAAGGTGQEGCYFGACDDDAARRPAPPDPDTYQPDAYQPETYEPDVVPPPPPVDQAFACVTPLGACAMPGTGPVGTVCTCYVGGMPVAQGATQYVPQSYLAAGAAPAAPAATAQTCLTDFGACYLGQPLAPWTPCYCPTAAGPVWGVAQ